MHSFVELVVVGTKLVVIYTELVIQALQLARVCRTFPTYNFTFIREREERYYYLASFAAVNDCM